jgi:GTP-binding protein
MSPPKARRLDNMCASGKDETIRLIPALEFIPDDELVEVPPKLIHLSKKMLNENDRKRYGRSKFDLH